MSKQNKVNKSNYDQAGRLTPDEIARERMRQAKISSTQTRERFSGRRQQPPGPGGRAAFPHRNDREE